MANHVNCYAIARAIISRKRDSFSSDSLHIAEITRLITDSVLEMMDDLKQDSPETFQETLIRLKIATSAYYRTIMLQKYHHDMLNEVTKRYRQLHNTLNLLAYSLSTIIDSTYHPSTHIPFRTSIIVN